MILLLLACGAPLQDERESTPVAPDTAAWCLDADQDGFGNPTSCVEVESQPQYYVADGTDCDDGDALVFPGATEHCDGADEDCDGTADDDAIDPLTWYTDEDGDGFGHGVLLACAQPQGSSATDGDCDDSDADVHPGAVEHCDDIDEDCDGLTDNDAVDPPTFYLDDDADGIGDEAVTACDQPERTVVGDGDCDDTNSGIYPGAPEHCDEVDEDCDGTADNDPIDPSTFYTDTDADGFGAESIEACDEPAGTALVAGDCDDVEATIFPGAPEHCDDVDEDCDGMLDNDALDPAAWYWDDDGDGFGGTAILACDQPSGAVGSDGDCDDGDATINPGALEFCDGLDGDCDGAVDDDPVDPSTFYLDDDGDGFGAKSIEACDLPGGAALTADDCDDSDAAIFPGAPEHCNDKDEDCDGVVDNEPVDPATFYVDGDADGFGSESIMGCEQPGGTALTGDDCDDGHAAVFPGAAEHCDEVDEDCDGVADNDPVDPPTFYLDGDADGFGSELITACDQPAGTVFTSGDCDDGNAAIFPGAPEHCDDVDEDCDTLPDNDPVDPATFYVDGDADGFGVELVVACDQPEGTALNSDDCDESNGAVYPGAPEHCDEADEDCDGVVDNDVIDDFLVYPDADGDGVGADSGAELDCALMPGWSASSGDCDDADVMVSPLAHEVCADGIDNDCDGTEKERCGPEGEFSLADAETRVVGNSDTWEFGNHLAMVGDLNGDGLGEAGAHLQWSYEVTVAAPARGSATALAEVADMISTGISDDAPRGADLDGDELGELLIPVSQDGDDAGLLIYEGPLSSTLERADAIATIDPTGFSSSLDGARGIGDNDGDGVIDLAVAHVGNVYDDAYGWGENVGQIFVMSGPFSGASMLADAVARIHPHVRNEFGTFGASMCATDLDGDGINDLAGGAPGGSDLYYLPLALRAGAVYTAFGPFAEDRQLDDGSGGLVDGDALWAWASSVKPMYAGWDVSCADTDGDGTPEILIGSLDDGASGPGAAWLVPGTATGAHAVAEADWSIAGTASGEVLGISVSLDSDLDADGRADLVVGSYQSSHRGRVGVFYGRTFAGAASLDDADATFAGAETDDLAAMVAGGDDLDADGFDDLLIGAPNSAEGGEYAGAIYVIYGGE